MTDFSRWQTDVLFLLVGENPLPNYVVARLLLKEGNPLYLVHSRGPTGTGEIARRLAKQLDGYESYLISVDEHCAPDLRAAIEDQLADTLPGAVGLNYTGGTKFMAVHTYQAIEEFCKNRGRPLTLSYLHADTLELTIEPGLGQDGLCRPVVHEVKPTFAEIFDLHGLESNGNPRTKPRHVALAGALAEMNSSPEGFKAWKECRKVLKDGNRRVWSKVRGDMRQSGATEAVIEALEDALGLEASRPLNLLLSAKQAGLGTSGGLDNWLRGLWLEDWTLACVEECAAEAGCHEWLGDVKGLIPADVAGGAPAREFQIDVAAMRGYQLFAISCKAVSYFGDAKLGLLEIFARARQMGGEEARAALVTTQLDAAKLKQDFASDWGADKRVRVFGCRQLPDLATHLANWFEHP